jgi:ribonuclease P protein component
MPSVHTFPREERLKSRKMIGRLFKEGRSFVSYPLRVVWLPFDENEGGAAPIQLAISVPKRAFKTAVGRNLLKRRIREAYRLNKSDVSRAFGFEERPVALMLVYVAKETLPYAEIERGMKKIVKKVDKENSGA